MATRPELEDFARDHMFLGAAHDENARRTRSVIVLTVAMMIAEIGGGYWTGSMALLADGFHMATHAGALAVAAVAYAYARRHVGNPAFSFGTGKIGDLAGFASAMVLGLAAVGIAYESATRLVEPVTVAFGEATIVAAIGLAVNLVSALMLGGQHAGHAGHDHAHDDSRDHGHDHHGADNNLRSIYFHVLADALTSVLAIGALLAGQFLGWVWLDPVIGIVGALIIARWAWTLMVDTAAILLDRTNDALAARVRALVEGPGDARIADLHVWRVGPEAHAAIVSFVAEREVGADTVRERLTSLSALSHLTVERR